ncbi:MAG TPA: hypothetical protein VIV63_00890 [Steroidobacteraceae bacterium]
MRRCLTLLMLLAGASASVGADAEAEVQPLQCGWRTDRVAVHVGEPLRLTLTCAAAETDAATVMPDWDQLQPDVVDLAPFEVVAGTRSEDVVTPPWRYTQFEYTLRLTGEEFFGLDVPLPPLEIAYSIAVGPRGGNVQMGRERTYVLPPLPMKILALVPARASDIEDVTAHSFVSIERRRSQASMVFLVSCGLLAAGALYLLLFLGSAWRAMRTRRVKPAFRIPDWRLVLGARAALRKQVSAAGKQGWTDARVGEALAVLRVLGAVAAGLPVRQQVAARDRPAGNGEWLLRRLSLRRPYVAISATVTAAQLRAHASLEELAVAIAVCSDVRYGPEIADGGMPEVGRAIQDALGASRELLVASLLPSRLQFLAGKRVATGAA